jgi:hypothetical protein
MARVIRKGYRIAWDRVPVARCLEKEGRKAFTLEELV